MKRYLLIATAFCITLSSMAAPKGFVGGVRPVVGHTVVVARPLYYGGYGLGYRPYFGFNSFYNPYYSQPSQLDLNISQINSDYAAQISDVRRDKSLPRSERRQKISDLRHDKESAIIDAKRDYYHPQAVTQHNDDLINP